MHRGLSPTIFIGVIELDAQWSDHLQLTEDESPWEHLLPVTDNCLSDAARIDISEAAELLANNERLQSELDEQYALLLRARRSIR